MTGFSNPQAMWDKRFSTPDYEMGYVNAHYIAGGLKAYRTLIRDKSV